MAFFYEIRSSSNAVLKRDGGFATQDAAKIVAREDANHRRIVVTHLSTFVYGCRI